MRPQTPISIFSLLPSAYRLHCSSRFPSHYSTWLQWASRCICVSTLWYISFIVFYCLFSLSITISLLVHKDNATTDSRLPPPLSRMRTTTTRRHHISHTIKNPKPGRMGAGLRLRRSNFFTSFFLFHQLLLFTDTIRLYINFLRAHIIPQTQHSCGATG